MRQTCGAGGARDSIASYGVLWPWWRGRVLAKAPYQRFAQQPFDLPVEAAHVVFGPAPQLFEQRRGQAQQEPFLVFGQGDYP